MYTCPMHPEVKSQNKGRCPKCGMELVPEGSQGEISIEEKTNYTALFTIIGLIFLSTLFLTFKDLQDNIFQIKSSISYFMIGFFLVFGGFKLIDLKGFAQGYSTYDLLAKRFFPYGYIFPFIEVAFGLLMILTPVAKPLLFTELLVMGFSGLGVLTSLNKKVRCVCLGTIINVPLGTITLLEDFGMAGLALLMLFL